MPIHTDTLHNLNMDVTIPVKDILILENGLIKTSTGKIVEIAIGSNSGGLEIETIQVDNNIEIPGTDLNIDYSYVIDQEDNENSWSSYKITVFLKELQSNNSVSLDLLLAGDDGEIEGFQHIIMLPLEIKTDIKALIYEIKYIPYPGFRQISLQMVNENEISNINKISIDLMKFDKARNIENIIVKSFTEDPIVSVPGQAWYNSTENKYKYTLLDKNGTLIISTLSDSEDLADQLIWMTVM